MARSEREGDLSKLKAIELHEIIKSALTTCEVGASWSLHDFVVAGLIAHNHTNPRDAAVSATHLIEHVAKSIVFQIGRIHPDWREE